MGRKVALVMTSAVSLTAGLAIGLAGPAGASTAAPQASTSACADRSAAPALARYRVTPGESLDRFVRVHGYAPGQPTDPADVLGFTYDCTPGWPSRAMLRYIDAGRWHAPLTGVRYLWSWKQGLSR